MDVVLLGKKRKKKGISLAKTGHASEIKKRKNQGRDVEGTFEKF